MILVAWSLALVLWSLALVHAAWGFGSVWPAADAAALARTVVGARGRKRMPGLAACLVVAVVLCAAGQWPLAVIGALPISLPPMVLLVGGVACALVFLGRGLAAYSPAWRRLTPEQPFARLDRLFYGPLCLALGIGYLWIVWKGFA